MFPKHQYENNRFSFDPFSAIDGIICDMIKRNESNIWNTLSCSGATHLKYGSTTWHPFNKKLTNRLESYQRFACRVILQSWKASHEVLLLKSDLPPLSKCRNITTLCHLFKIVHGLCSSPNPFQPHPQPNLWEPQLLCPGSPFLPADLVPDIILSICSYTLELSSRGYCPVQVSFFL